jgi:hypothetical protein
MIIPFQNWTSANIESLTLSIPQMSELLQFKFCQYTGAERMLSESDLYYLMEKLFGVNQKLFCSQTWRQCQELITYNQFAKVRNNITRS